MRPHIATQWQQQQQQQQHQRQQQRQPRNQLTTHQPHLSLSLSLFSEIVNIPLCPGLG